MNKALDELLVQMREMRLTPDELDAIIAKYENGVTKAHVLIHTAATMLALEVAFTQ